MDRTTNHHTLLYAAEALNSSNQDSQKMSAEIFFLFIFDLKSFGQVLLLIFLKIYSTIYFKKMCILGFEANMTGANGSLPKTCGRASSCLAT